MSSTETSRPLPDAAALFAEERRPGRYVGTIVVVVALLSALVTFLIVAGLTPIVPTHDVVVTMGCGDACPLVKAKQRFDWQIPDPREMGPDEFRKVRDLIAAKVRELLTMLGMS